MDLAEKRMPALKFVAPIAIATLAAMLIGPAHAEDTPDKAPLPKVVDDVVACRALPDQLERLACYDRTVPVLAASHAQGEVIIAGKEDVRKAREGLFGLNLSAERLFGARKADDDASPRQIDALITSARQNRRGQWIFTIDSGAQWAQLDDRILYRSPEPGSSRISIREAAIGSYLANVDGQRAIRVKRVID
jgi:hypothetical protein